MTDKNKVNSTGLPDKARNSRVFCAYAGRYYYGQPVEACAVGTRTPTTDFTLGAATVIAVVD